MSENMSVKPDALNKLVDDYDLDKHRIGSDLLASHYMKFWREVAKVVRS